MDLSYGACVAATLFPLVCGHAPMNFREVYRQTCMMGAQTQHWQGFGLEDMTAVQTRVMDGAALYQDYLRTWHEECDGGSRGDRR